jgi:hypothetical protein
MPPVSASAAEATTALGMVLCFLDNEMKLTNAMKNIHIIALNN